MSEWKPIETAPIGQNIDVWVWNLDEDGSLADGFRWPEVKIQDGVAPVRLDVWQGDPDFGGEWASYSPDQNGQYVSHWMPLPTPPTHNPEKEE